MSDIVVAATISRTELSLSALNLNDGTTVKVVSYDPGSAVKTRVVGGSPTLDGHVQAGSKVDGRVVLLTLRIYGASKAAIDSTAQTIFNAFEQSSYTLSIQLDNATVVWACDDAEYRPVTSDGDGIEHTGLASSPRRQSFAFTIPVQPAPTSGVY